jgi:hypothetical protein
MASVADEEYNSDPEFRWTGDEDGVLYCCSLPVLFSCGSCISLSSLLSNDGIVLSVGLFVLP